MKQKLSRLHRFLLLVIPLLFNACVPAAETPRPTETPVPLPSETVTPSPTVIWFPPTSTPTPFADLPPSPTTFPPPPLGDVLITDRFEDGSLWSLTQSTRGSSAIGLNELTIVLNEPRAYIAATRVDVFLTDYYIEATAATSLCAGEDEYGMILRAASPSDFYRFSLSCDGRLRVDLIRGGTASSPLPWTFSAAVPRNAPGQVRLGVWVAGDVMHLFLNDAYQVTVSTAFLPGGSIGFFARSGGENAVTVNFSELSVWGLE